MKLKSVASNISQTLRQNVIKVTNYFISTRTWNKATHGIYFPLRNRIDDQVRHQVEDSLWKGKKG